MTTKKLQNPMLILILAILSLTYGTQQISLNDTIRNEFDEEISANNGKKTMEIFAGNGSDSGNSSINDAADKLTKFIDSNTTLSNNSQTNVLEASFTTPVSILPTTTVASTEFDNYAQRCKKDTEIYSNCSNSCPASCEEPTRKPCRTYCWRGCECAPGHVKNYRWRCIPIEECPKCNANEHYRNCGSNCEATCDNYQNMPVYCNQRASCKRGCFCNYGFVRDESKNGTCVPIDQCPQKCPENEYWEPNGEPCLRTLDNPRPSCLFEKPKAACVCNTGFRRNPKSSLCEPVSKLINAKHDCSGNETFSFCGSDCATNCFDESKRHMCPTICKRGCFCNDGYRRDGSGSCVLPDDCKQWSQNHVTPIFRV